MNNNNLPNMVPPIPNQNQENNNLSGSRSIVNKPNSVFLNNIESKIEDISKQSSQEERETKNFCEKCLNNISNCFGLC